jgi:hypothetical protein
LARLIRAPKPSWPAVMCEASAASGRSTETRGRDGASDKTPRGAPSGRRHDLLFAVRKDRRTGAPRAPRTPPSSRAHQAAGPLSCAQKNGVRDARRDIRHSRSPPPCGEVEIRSVARQRDTREFREGVAEPAMTPPEIFCASPQRGGGSLRQPLRTEARPGRLPAPPPKARNRAASTKPRHKARRNHRKGKSCAFTTTAMRT